MPSSPSAPPTPTPPSSTNGDSYGNHPNNQLISASGLDFEEAANIAAWVRSLNPDPNLVLWFTTSVFDGHTVLTPGITPQQVIDRWVDHAEHDPYIEYPPVLPLKER